MRRRHREQEIRTVQSGEQRTNRDDVSRRAHMRDALGNYAAHDRLDQSVRGGLILDDVATLQLAVADALKARESTDWARAADFRSSGDIRKLRSGEMVATMTDLAVILAIEPDAFTEFAETVARLAGGQFTPSTRRPVSLSQSAAKTVRTAAELSALVHEAESPTSESGRRLSLAERRQLRQTVSGLKSALADVEVKLDDGGEE